MNRRQFLLTTGHGFGVVALSSLLEASTVNPLSPKAPHAAAKAKSIIYLFMHGGVSHVDTFDPKPELTRRSGQALSVELAKTIKTSFIHDPTKAVLRGSPWTFRPGGKCGLPVSDLFPQGARVHGRHRGHPRLSRRCVRSCPGNLSSQYGTRSFPVNLVSAPGLRTALEQKIRICRPLS